MESHLGKGIAINPSALFKVFFWQAGPEEEMQTMEPKRGQGLLVCNPLQGGHPGMPQSPPSSSLNHDLSVSRS